MPVSAGPAGDTDTGKRVRLPMPPKLPTEGPAAVRGRMDAYDWYGPAVAGPGGRVMGVHEGRGALARGLKDLLHRWTEVKGAWRDAAADQFEEKFLFELEREIRTATTTMDTMAQMLAQVQRDCR